MFTAKQIFAAIALFGVVACNFGGGQNENEDISGAYYNQEGRILSMPPYKIGVPYQIHGQWYYPREDFTYDRTGIASWYGDKFHGKKTANGETYNKLALTAAHRTLPLPTIVEVTNLLNGKSMILRINDRGPYVEGRIIDLSQRAASYLDIIDSGTAPVRVKVLERETKALVAAIGLSQSSQNISEQELAKALEKDLNRTATTTSDNKILYNNDQPFTTGINDGNNPPLIIDNPEVNINNLPIVGSSEQQLPDLDSQYVIKDDYQVDQLNVDQANSETPKFSQGTIWQVGAFEDSSNARAAFVALQDIKVAAKIEPLYVEGGILYRLRIGPLTGGDAALARLRDTLLNMGFENPILIN